MGQSSTATASSDPNWRYGVYLFPLAPLLLAVAYVGMMLFVQSVDAESAGIGIAAFAATVLANWASYLFAAVATVAVVGDARALRDHPSWNPNPWLAGGLGLAHVAGSLLVVPYALSIPGFGYYIYARRQHVGGTDGGDEREPTAASSD